MSADQLPLFDVEARERLRAIYAAAEAWSRKVKHLRRCKVEPWWDCKGDCDE